MRSIATIAGIALAFGGLTYQLQPVQAEAAKKKAAGKVSFYKGTVQRSRSKSGPWKKLKRGKPFYKGDYIRTKKKSRVELRFRDRSVVRLGPKTTLQLKEASFAGKQKKKVSGLVKAGRAWANVHKYVSGKAAFDLRTENAVAGVRGTVFSMATGATGTKINVWAGQVAVNNSPYVQAMQNRKEVPAHRRTSKAPINFGNRKAVNFKANEISAEQWETMVGAMQTVAVGPDGKQSEVASFTEDEAQKGEDAEWVAWNRDLDKASGNEH